MTKLLCVVSVFFSLLGMWYVSKGIIYGILFVGPAALLAALLAAITDYIGNTSHSDIIAVVIAGLAIISLVASFIAKDFNIEGVRMVI